MLGISELAILLIVVILILGAKKLPELARSAGKSARILKAEAKAMKKDRTADDESHNSPPQVIEGRVMPPQDTDNRPDDHRNPGNDRQHPQ
ncbi:Sec-independent protein translocase subunit TatA [Streptomyces sp. NPDC002851]